MVIRRRLELSGPAMAFITTTVKSWIPLFSNDKAALTALEELNNTLGIYQVSLMAYVLMPSHFHIIIFLPQIERLSKFIQCFKGISSKRIKELNLEMYNHSFLINGQFRLWKPRFDDFILRNQDQFETKLNYIHNNPVRAGLVKDAIDYKYSSAREWLTGEKGLVKIDPTIVWR